jgi:hypothetical protein
VTDLDYLAECAPIKFFWQQFERGQSRSARPSNTVKAARPNWNYVKRPAPAAPRWPSALLGQSTWPARPGSEAALHENRVTAHNATESPPSPACRDNNSAEIDALGECVALPILL